MDQRLMELIDRLPPTQARRVKQNKLYKLSYRDIAALEWVTKSAIQYSVRRGIENLKRQAKALYPVR
jgi:DNA-directed RNA polymerase specialized sigma24 family protein